MALKDLHLILQHTDKINMAEFCKKNKINKAFGWQAQKWGLIKQTGTKGRGSRWKWTTITPTREMAMEVYDRLLDLSKKYEAKSKEKNTYKKEGKKQVKKKRVAYYEGSFLGFKIKVRPVYEA